MGPVTEQVVKSNDPHGGRGRVCEIDMARVRVYLFILLSGRRTEGFSFTEG